MRKMLKAIAAAAAAAVIMFCSAVSASADRIKTVSGIMYRYTDSGALTGKYTGWAKTKSGARYYYKDGEMIKNKWIAVKGQKTYYLRSSGKAATGCVNFKNGNMYHFGDNGKAVFGINVYVKETDSEKVSFGIKELVLNDRELEVDVYPDFTLQRMDMNGEWRDVPSIVDKDETAWAEYTTPLFTAYEYGEKSETAHFGYLYGTLEDGDYRCIYHYSAAKYSGISYTGKIYVPFTIEAEDDDEGDDDLVFSDENYTYEELQGVYNTLVAHKSEFGLDEIKIEDNHIIVSVNDNLVSKQFYDYLNRIIYGDMVIVESQIS